MGCDDVPPHFFCNRHECLDIYSDRPCKYKQPIEETQLMHSATINDNIVIHHNGDFSGNVEISAKDWLEEAGLGMDSRMTVRIPFEELRNFVFEALRRKAIANLENMSFDHMEAVIVESLAEKQPSTGFDEWIRHSIQDR